MGFIPEYIYMIRPYHQELAFHPTPEEETILSEHFTYLQRAASEGIVVIAGPSLDGLFGVVILHAEDEGAAQHFMSNDPAVKGNLMAAELHPFRLSVVGKIP